MATLTTRDGREWMPSYIESIDAEACIGCGRCFKVCGQSVLAPIEKPYDEDEDDDEYGEETASQIMSVADPGACIGCVACARVCAKRAPKHAV
ncbi:MAG: ferredoxin III, nif-specific [Coriobacteriales bacterium]|nr:ferredoxin III, nif-specific [Coriobacteriales bacterium]